METVADIVIKGTPPYAKDYPVWIVRVDENKQDGAWFFGAYESEEYAQEIITDIHRAVIVKQNPCSSMLDSKPFIDLLTECEGRMKALEDERLPFMDTREHEVELDAKISELKSLTEKLKGLL